MSIIFSSNSKEINDVDKWGDLDINSYVIVRTYSAGVWFGKIHEFKGGEIILSEARRMFAWHAKESISLSACAKYGIKKSESKICAPVAKVWLQAIEVLALTAVAIDDLLTADIVEAG